MTLGEYDNIVSYLRSLSPELIAEANRLDVQCAAEEHTCFLSAFKQEKCYLCNESIHVFCETKPCCHWLLNPRGFKKRHFPHLFGRFGFYQIQSYLRWVASVDTPFRDINDLIFEHSGKKKIDLTIRWGLLAWSFSCTDSDMRGHQGSTAGSAPHYHFQLACDEKVIIKYNDFHVPFDEEDLRTLHLTENYPELAQHEFAFGNGMQDLMSAPMEKLLETAQPTEDSDRATLHIQTIIRSRSADGISGEEIQAVFQEARQKGVTIASLAHKLKGNVVRVIEAGPGVPEPRERHPRRRLNRG